MEITRLSNARYESVAMTGPVGNKHEQNINQEPTKTVRTGNADISYDKDANVFVFKWTDENSKEVIQQVPVQTMIEFAKQVNQTLGNVIDTKV